MKKLLCILLALVCLFSFSGCTFIRFLFDNSTDPTQPTQPTQPNPTGKNVIYCKNEAGWGKVNVYLWAEIGDLKE